MEGVNKQRRNITSLSELGYGLLKFSFRRARLHLQSKWVAIIAVKTNRTQIHFLSDVLVGGTLLDLKSPYYNSKTTYGKNCSFLLLCFCCSVFMFRLCKVETSVNNPPDNDITKNQSERLKKYRSLSPSGTIFNMAASGEDVVGRDVKVHIHI